MILLHFTCPLMRWVKRKFKKKIVFVKTGSYCIILVMADEALPAQPVNFHLIFKGLWLGWSCFQERATLTSVENNLVPLIPLPWNQLINQMKMDIVILQSGLNSPWGHGFHWTHSFGLPVWPFMSLLGVGNSGALAVTSLLLPRGCFGPSFHRPALFSLGQLPSSWNYSFLMPLPNLFT